MAAQTTPTYDIQTSTGTAGAENKPTEVGGRKRMVYAIYTTTATVLVTETIKLFKIPPLARVVSLVIIVPAAVGTTSSKVGILTNDSLYGSGQSLNVAGRFEYITTTAATNTTPLVAGGNPSINEETIILTPVTATFATAITFVAICEYVVD